MVSCKYWDCGWCYAPDDVKPSTSATPHKQCLNPDCCLNLKSQMTEIEKTEGEIKVLQAKLELLKEMEKYKTPVEEAYKRVYGNYPDTGLGTGFSYVWWDVFQKAYEQAQKDYKVGEYQPTPQEPEELKTLYDICVEWNDDDYDPPVSALIFKIEKEWTPLNLNQKEKRGYTDGYSMGFDDALNLVRKTLR